MDRGIAVRRSGRVLLAAVASLMLGIALLAHVPSARADGDPASDYLLNQQTFVGAQVLKDSPQQRQLISTVKAANRAGFAIRVAVISGPYDLGSIKPVWHEPKVYAGFLGVELSLAYKQRLLVVMPNGFGFYWHGHTGDVTAAYRTLAKVSTKAGADNLALAAATGVRQLAAAQGITVTAGGSSSGAAATTTSSSGLGLGSILLLIAAAGALLLGLAWMARIRRSSQAAAGGQTGSDSSRRPALRSWATAVALLAAVAVVGTTVAVTRVARSNTGSSTSAKASGQQQHVSHKPGLPNQSWAAGSKRAPDFVLRDEGGKPISISQFKGRPVILTFIDPLCRVFCPLQAQTLNHVVGLMPASKRPAILAVSVDPPADAPKDLQTDNRRWHLIPQWHWVVGTPAQLKAVWKHYHVGVQVITRKIGGKVVRSITHTAASFVIDSSGYQRGVFLWPFYTPDIQRELRVVQS